MGCPRSSPASGCPFISDFTDLSMSSAVVYTIGFPFTVELQRAENIRKVSIHVLSAVAQPRIATISDILEISSYVSGGDATGGGNLPPRIPITLGVSHGSPSSHVRTTHCAIGVRNSLIHTAVIYIYIYNLYN